MRSFPLFALIALSLFGCSDDSEPPGGVSGSAAMGGSNQGGTGGAQGGTGGKAGSSGKGGASGSGGSGGGSAAAGGACGVQYRNLFVEILGKSTEDVAQKLDAGFQHFFYGSDSQRIYYESGADEAYIHDINNDDVRSEGMSYGMMVAVQMDKQAEFDRLWKWAKSHMQQGNGYFAWQATPSGQVLSNGVAPDGEEYFATALIFAAHRWGAGAHDYARDARNLLNALRTNGAFNANPPVVKFGISGGSASYSDPSYVLPAFYQVWACFDTANASFWEGAIRHGRSVFQKATDPNTGLGAYLSDFQGNPHPMGSYFNSDSWRIVGNVMMDHHFFHADPWQEGFARRYAAFFENARQTSPNAYEFELNGSVRQSSSGPARGLLAQNALAAFAIPNEQAAPLLQALWDLGLPSGQYRYYDGMLYLFAMLHASGSFRLY